MSLTPQPEIDLTGNKAAPRRGILGHVRELFRMRVDKSTARVGLAAICFTGLFCVIGGRLVYLAMTSDASSEMRRVTSSEISAARPDIVDRNGDLLATDVKMVSVFAEPRNIIDKDEAVELLTAVLPDLDATDLRNKLGTKKGFVWVKREITPRQQSEVHHLGIPGVGFLPENKRIYPNAEAASHVLGFANVDNIGIAGIEKYIDSQGLQDLNGAGFNITSADLKPVQLSIDLRVQHALRDELQKGMAKFKAKAVAGAIMDVNTGEMIALVSLPDYDPNNPVDALEDDRINRINVGVFEMGSTFKALTTAMALDSGKFNINSSLDARSGLRYGRFTIGDYHPTRRVLTVPEVFIHSSNIGTARMALGVGVEGHKAFLRKMGQLTRLKTELPENAEPIVPGRWGELNTMTIAFGHGLAVAPLQALMAVGALSNGGMLITPTFLKRDAAAAREGALQVIKPETSEAMRYVMRLNASNPAGSASTAAIAGFYVGGKTGTAEKVINGRYSKNKNLTTFTAILPADKPKYVFLTIMDEPQAVPGTYGFSTAGWNAGPVTGDVIERVAPLLGVPPRFEPPAQPFPLMSRLGAWGTR
ncbi:peptidoglycan D,D-transpeptidase FtsI family protein [Microvirga brassicacearum]|uniref:Penicillin-binding protein 2 n=1 Tax=Microvirga brassicacearum TaxID=2580413 RepID=A0A5N3PB93_9HYPH|nr:penicillin-binding protein 2 [Microvirga brassicacearum]KAB0267032.1 penicillin-binding protein 2 [Microvirga brassicacearum]